MFRGRGFLTGCIAAGLWLGSASDAAADTLTIGGRTYHDVSIVEGSSMYYVTVPALDKTLSFPKEDVESGEVTIVRDDSTVESYRQQLEQRLQPTRSIEIPNPALESLDSNQATAAEASAEPTPNAVSTDSVEITVKAILIGEDLSLTPVPRELFVIVSEPEGAAVPMQITTSFDGESRVRLAPGTYRIRSADGVTFEGKQFRWDRRFTVSVGGTTVELSNDNAVVAALPQTPGPETSPATTRQFVAPAVFKAADDAVATVETEIGSGTAFLVDDEGLFLTNDHVVSGSRFFVIRFSENERYRAFLVHSLPNEDVAVLMVNPQVTKNRPVLGLANDSAQNPAVREGEQVFALGSPLHQEKIITSGVISKVEEGALISDVMIDRGNSGGPLLNASKEVVGINTFAEGRGVSGIVRIWKALPVLQEARAKSEFLWKPPAEPLPAYPTEKYPAESLREIALSTEFDLRDYYLRAKKFDVLFLTPPAEIYYELETEIEAAKGRQKKRRRKNVQSLDTHDPTSHIRGWGEYVGEYAPTVKIWIQPRKKATFGSALGAALLGAPSLRNYKYAGEFDEVRLIRDGTEQPIIRMGRMLNQEVYANRSGHMEDAAYGGYAEYLPYAFRPTGSRDKEVTLIIENELKPENDIEVEVPRKMLERIWQDFAPMRNAK